MSDDKGDKRIRAKIGRFELWALILILLLAASLRLIWPTITEFKLDEAQIVARAWDLAEFKQFPLYGTRSSIGIFLPPFGLYLYALPLLIWPHPLSAVIFGGLCGVLAVWLCWWLGRRYWGATAGLCAALWFATAPWAVAFSRKIWEPDLLPALALGYIIAGLLAFVERRPWALTAHLLLLAVIAQVHFSGVVLIPLTALLLIRYRQSVRWPALLAGLVLVVGSAIPFLIYLWRDWSAVRAALSNLSQAALLDARSLRLWWIMVSGVELHSLAGPQSFRDFLRLLPNLDPFRRLLALAIAGELLYSLWWAARRPQERAAQVAGIVALWALAPVLLFVRHSTDLFLHYFLVSLPAAALAFGHLAARGLAQRPRMWRWGTAGTLAAMTIANAVMILTLLNFLGGRASGGGFGIPLRTQLRVVEAARSEGAPILVLSPGDNPASDEWAAIFHVLLRRTPHRLVDGRRAVIFPVAPTNLLVTPGVEEALGVYERSGALEPLREIADRLGRERFRLARLHGEPALGLCSVQGPRKLANGIEFIGYASSGRAAPQQEIEWRLAWRVREMPADCAPRYHFYNHLLDSKGRRWAQADGVAINTRDWLAGDVVVQLFRLKLAANAEPGPYWVRAGMYTFPELRNQLVLDAEPGSPSDGVMLGPLTDG